MTEEEIRAKYGLATSPAPAEAPAAVPSIGSPDAEETIRQKYGLEAPTPAPASIAPPPPSPDKPALPSERYARLAQIAGDNGGPTDKTYYPDKRGILSRLLDPYGDLPNLPPNSLQARQLRASQGSENRMDKLTNYFGGIADTAATGLEGRVMSAPGAVLGSEKWHGNTNDDYLDAIKGNAKSGPELLKNQGYSNGVAYPLGLVTQMISEPFASAYTGGEAKMLPKDASILSKIANAATQQVRTVPGTGLMEKIADTARSPIRSAGQYVAEKIFRNAFKEGDAVIPTLRNSKSKEAGAYSKLLWNEGDPLVGGKGTGNKELGEQLRDVADQKGEALGDQIEAAGGGSHFNLAPELPGKVQEHLAGETNFPLEKMDLEDGQLPSDWLKDRKESAVALRDQMSQYRKDLMDEAKDLGAKADTSIHDRAIEGLDDHIADLESAISHVSQDPYDKLKELIQGKIPQRNKAISILQDASPRLSDTIANAAQGLTNHASDREKSLAWFNSLIGNLSEGDRTLPGMQSMRKDMNTVAYGTTGRDPSMRKAGSIPNARTANSAYAGQDVGSLIDDEVLQKLGEAGADKRVTLKDDYGTLVNSNKAMLGKIARAERRSAATGTEAAGWAFTAGKALKEKSIMTALPYIAAMTAGKVAKELRMSPATSVRAGRAMNALTSNNMWDSLLRTAEMQRERDKRKFKEEE